MGDWTSFATVGERSSQWRFILKLFFSLGLIGLVLFFLNFRELMNVVVKLNPWYLLAVVALIHLDRVLMAYKWNRLLLAVDVRVPFSLLVRTYLVAPLSGVLLPSTIGGDLFRLYSLSRYKANTRAVFVSMMVERGIALVVMLVLASLSLGLASYLMKDSWAHFAGIGWALVVGAMIAAGLIGVMHNVFRESISKLVRRFTEYPIVSKLYAIYLVCGEYRNHLRTVAIVSGWTLLEQMAPIVTNVLMVHALHINVSLLQMVAIIPLIVLTIRLPISLDGIGVQEGLYVALFGLVGVSAVQAFLLSTLLRVLALLSALPWAIHYIMTARQTPFPEQQLTIVKPQ